MAGTAIVGGGYEEITLEEKPSSLDQSLSSERQFGDFILPSGPSGLPSRIVVGSDNLSNRTTKSILMSEITEGRRTAPCPNQVSILAVRRNIRARILRDRLASSPSSD